MQNTKRSDLIAWHRHNVVPDFCRVHRSALGCNFLLFNDSRFKQPHPLQNVAVRCGHLVSNTRLHELCELRLVLRVG